MSIPQRVPACRDAVQGCDLRALLVLQEPWEAVCLHLGRKKLRARTFSSPHNQTRGVAAGVCQASLFPPHGAQVQHPFFLVLRVWELRHTDPTSRTARFVVFRSNTARLTALSASIADASALRQSARCTPVLLIPHDGPSKLGVALRDMEAGKK